MKKILFIFFIFFYCNTSRADIIITDFNEYVKFTDVGREVTIKIKAYIKLSSPSQYHNWWAYVFDKKLSIQVLEAKVLNKEYKTTFGNNELNFQFANVYDSNMIEFEFKYIQFPYGAEIKYNRDEFVLIPPFARKSNGKLTIEIPSNLAVYSLNNDFIQNYNTYTWSGIVPQDGFSDTFALTMKKAKWEVKITSELNGVNNFSKLDMILPLYFKYGNSSIERYKITANYDKPFAEIKEDNDDIVVSFENVNAKKAQIDINATLINDFENREWIRLDPLKFLSVNPLLAKRLNDVIFKIQEEDDKTPLHILLAKWVHNYIKYDDTQLGKEYATEQILSNGTGVCIHYAQLYNDLLRTAGIPSVIVSGVSYDPEKNSFENHAWNMVNVGGEWLPIDPTWGIYSGKLPITHIFFYFNDRPVINYTVYNSSTTDYTSTINKEIKFVELGQY